jgi:hypothetical protein
MNGYRLMILAWALATLTLPAQQTPDRLDASAENKTLDWSDPKWWESMETKSSGIKLGKTDLVLDGLAVKPFRRDSRPAIRRGLRERIRSLPFVNPLASKSADSPLRRENYFAWGERNTPWSTLADRPIPGPQSVLVSVHR